MATRLEATMEIPMDTDDLEQPEKRDKIKDLDVMSIKAIGDYISDLEREIERAKMAISIKNSAKSSAESIFEV